jgi:transketolase C-terminal domain/subunit
MRTPSAVIYGSDYTFEFGKGHVVRENIEDVAVIVSSGRGVHEALAASAECATNGLQVGVVDMPSIDEDLLMQLCQSGKTVCLAEQNNGFILQNLLKILYRRGAPASRGAANVLSINTLDADGRPQFIHSGTYEELIRAFGLAPAQIAAAIARRVRSRQP